MRFKRFILSVLAASLLTGCGVFSNVQTEVSSLESETSSEELSSSEESSSSSSSSSSEEPEPIKTGYGEAAVFEFEKHEEDSHLGMGYAALVGIKNKETATYADIPEYYDGLPVTSLSISDCEKLSIVKIPSSVTGLSSGTFSNCQYLNSIYIPKSVAEIEAGFIFGISQSNAVMFYCEASSCPSGWQSGYDRVQDVPDGEAYKVCYPFWGCSELLFYVDGLAYVGQSAKEAKTYIVVGAHSISEDVLRIPSRLLGNDVVRIAFGAFPDKNFNAVYVPSTVTSIGMNTVDDSSYPYGKKLVVKQEYDFETSFVATHILCQKAYYKAVYPAASKRDSFEYDIFYSHVLWGVTDFGQSEEGFLYAKTFGTITILECYIDADRIAVPLLIDSLPVTAIAPFAFSPKDISGQYAYYYDYDQQARWDLENLENGNDIAYGRRYKEITLPRTVKEIGDGAFFRCISLTKVVMEGEISLIPSYCFLGCVSLKEVVAENSDISEIEDDSFALCLSLERLPALESLETIGEYAFLYCESLFFHLPKSVKEIGQWAFDEMKALCIDEVNRDLKPEGGSNSFDSDLILCSFSESSIPGSDEFKETLLNSSTNSMDTNVYFDFYSFSADEDGFECVITDSSEVYEAHLVKTNSGIAWGENYHRDLVVPEYLQGVPVTTISKGTFGSDDYVESVYLPKTVKRIEPYAFSFCDTLKFVVVKNTIAFIGSSNFSGCDNFQHLFYEGSAADFAEVETNNATYFNTSVAPYVRFYSESKPSSSGQYWHYVNGVPTIW